MCNAWTGPSHVTRYEALALKGNAKHLVFFHVFNNNSFISNCMSNPGTLSLFGFFCLSLLRFAVAVTWDRLVGKLYMQHIG